MFTYGPLQPEEAFQGGNILMFLARAPSSTRLHPPGPGGPALPKPVYRGVGRLRLPVTRRNDNGKPPPCHHAGAKSLSEDKKMFAPRGLCTRGGERGRRLFAPPPPCQSLQGPASSSRPLPPARAAEPQPPPPHYSPTPSPSPLRACHGYSYPPSRRTVEEKGSSSGAGLLI